MTHYPSNEEIEKRFDEIYGNDLFKKCFKLFTEGAYSKGSEKDSLNALDYVNNIKRFISQTRLSDLDAIIEKVERIRKEADGALGVHGGRDELISRRMVLSYLNSLKNRI